MMDKLSNTLSTVEKGLLLSVLIVAIPALFINLGLRVFYEDEGIRGLVALEMMLSGNYITPTLNDTFYYSKPPLYNWILVLFFKCFGGISEWSLRIPTVIFLAIYTGLILVVNQRFLDLKKAIIIALAFLTCGRILFWDSMLGYIDMSYSLVSYAMIMLFYIKWKYPKYDMQAYLTSALLLAIGYMLKGFPSFLFYGFGLMAVMVLTRSLDVLKNKWLYISLCIPVLVIGAYYWVYGSYNDATKTLSPLLDQSTRRTIVRYDIVSMIKHIFSYPFENLYHFFPWTIMVIGLLRLDVIRLIRSNDFIAFCTLSFMLNISVYWVSPEVYPRYILMLIPLLFTVITFAYFHAPSFPRRVMDLLFKILVLVAPMIITALLIKFWNALDAGFVIASVICLVASTVLLWVYFKKKNTLLLLLVISLLLVRVVFNFTIITDRHKRDFAVIAKSEALRIAESYPDGVFTLYENSKLDYTSSLYMSNKRMIQNKRSDDWKKTDYLIVDTVRTDFPACNYSILDSFKIREQKKTMLLIRCDE